MKETNKTKGLKLFTQGEIQIKDGRSFTRLYGGFGEDRPIITIKQIGELLGKEDKHINERIKENLKHFENGIHILDLKVVGQTDHYKEVLKSLGYNNMAISKSKNIYILSEAGFLLYLKFAEGDTSVEVYKDFIDEYFKLRNENKVMENTLNSALKTIVEERKYIVGSAFLETDEKKKEELFKRNEVLIKQEIEIIKTITREETIEQVHDIIEIADRFSNSKGYFDVGDFAKCLAIKDFGRNKLFQWLRNKEILMYDNVPYQRYVDKFKVITEVVHGHVNTKTLIRPTGMKYIVKKLIEDEKIPNSSYDEIMTKIDMLKEIAS